MKKNLKNHSKLADEIYENCKIINQFVTRKERKVKTLELCNEKGLNYTFYERLLGLNLIDIDNELIESLSIDNRIDIVNKLYLEMHQTGINLQDVVELGQIMQSINDAIGGIEFKKLCNNKFKFGYKTAHRYTYLYNNIEHVDFNKSMNQNINYIRKQLKKLQS